LPKVFRHGYPLPPRLGSEHTLSVPYVLPIYILPLHSMSNCTNYLGTNFLWGRSASNGPRQLLFMLCISRPRPGQKILFLIFGNSPIHVEAPEQSYSCKFHTHSNTMLISHLHTEAYELYASFYRGGRLSSGMPSLPGYLPHT